MMTGSSDEPSQNFIPTEDPKGSSGEICETGQSGQFVSVRPIDSSTHSPCSFGRNDIDELQTLVPRHAKNYRDVISTEGQRARAERSVERGSLVKSSMSGP